MKKRIFSFMLALIMVFSLLPVHTLAASGYTTCASGTVSWQMIYDGPETYYWIDSDGEYCKLTATQSGSYYYVTLYRSKKGTELRYLRSDKSDDSSSKHEWASASTKYTGGVLYKIGGSSSGSETGGSGTGSDTGNATTTIADGTYMATSNSTVNKNSENYAATVTITVSGGKITSITATGPSTSKNKEYFSDALSGVRSQLVNVDATATAADGVDKVSGATKSTNIIKEAIQKALSNAPTSGGSGTGSGSGTGTGTDVTITNPATATGNDLSLTKELIHNNDDTYSIRLTAYATKGIADTGSTSSYISEGNGKEYTYKDINKGDYYYLYNGTYYKVETEYNKNYKDHEYAAYFQTGSVKYWLTTKGKITTDRSNEKVGAEKDSKKVYKSDGTPLYTKAEETTPTVNTIGTAAVLKDTINTTNFDTSAATVTITSGNGTKTFNQTSGLVTVTGYDYTGNYNGTPLVVTISGLTAKKTGSNLASNSGNAGIYASSSASSALVSVASPTVTIPETQKQTISYTVTFRVVNGSWNDGTTANQTVTVSGEEGSTLRLTASQIPAVGGKPANGYTQGDWAITPNTIRAITGNTTYVYTYVADVPAKADGVYGDNGTKVERFGYTPIVAVTVENGKITDITADADTSENNLDYLNDAIEAYRTQLVGQPVSAVDTLDTVSSATYASTAVRAELQKALSEDPKGPYTVTWLNADGTVLETDSNVKYGTRTSYDGVTPTRAEDANYQYTFKEWNPSISTFVTDSVDYSATYNRTEKANAYELAVSDITYDLETGTITGAKDNFKADESYYVHPDAVLKKNGTQINYNTRDFYISLLSEDEEIVKSYLDGDYWLILTGKPGETYVTMKFFKQLGSPENGIKGEELASTRFKVTVTEPQEDGKYIDGTQTVTATHSYIPTVTVNVENGKIKNVTAVADTTDLAWLATALTKVNNTVSGKMATAAIFDEVDVKGGATFSTQAIVDAAKKALAAENTISWVDVDDTLLDTAKVTTGTLPPYGGAKPTREGYNFIGWTPDVHVVNGNETYKATYEILIVDYTVNYNLNGGTGTVTDDTRYSEGATVTVSTEKPVRDGYWFAGWMLDGTSVTDSFTMPNHDVTLVARWEKQLASGVYGDNSTTVERYGYIPIVAVTVEDGVITDVTIDAETTARNKGYLNKVIEAYKERLVGQPTSAVADIDTVSGATYSSVAVKAELEKALSEEPKGPYIVRWLDEDDTLLETDGEVKYGTRTSYDGETPSKDADGAYTYEFDGWTPAVSTFVTADADYHTAFAKTLRTYTVTWVNEDGTVLRTDENVPYGTTPVFGGTVPVKTDDAQYVYTFTGWTPEITAVTGDVTYIAVYDGQAKSYEIRFVSGAVDVTSLPTEQTAAVGQIVTINEEPKRTGYAFAGWTSEDTEVTGNTFTMPAQDVTLTAQWVRDDSQTKDVYYTVVHDVDGSARFLQQYNDTAWINEENPTILIQAGSLEPAFYEGYKLQSINTDKQEGEAVAHGTAITLTYVKDDSQTQPTVYTVEYYKDGVKVEADTVTQTGTAWINEENPVIEITELDTAAQKYRGYALTGTEPEVLPANGDTVQTGTVLKVYYTKSTPAWTWEKKEDGNYIATATFTYHDGSTETIDAAVASSITKEATCTEDGEILYTATAAIGAEEYTTTYTEAIPAAHTLTKVEAKVATCEADGSIQYYICEVCGKLFADAEATAEITSEDTIVSAMGHDWDEGVVTTPATCEEDGVKTYTCKHDTTHTYTEVIPATGHDWIVEITPATCEGAGVEKHICKNDASHNYEVEIPAIGHDWEETIKEATCTEDGVKTYTCKHDPAHTHSEVIPALGHEWGENGGACIRCGEAFPAKITGASAVLNGKIALRFTVEINQDVIQCSYVEFTIDDKTIQIPVSEGEVQKSGVQGKEIRIFEVSLNAMEMTKPVKIQVIVGGAQGKTVTYSIQKYAKSVLKQTSAAYEKAKPLIRAMLNYGGYAQTYFNYNLDDLANDGLYEPDKDPVLNEEIPDLSQYKSSKTVAEGDIGINVLGASLLLESETELRFYFTLEAGKSMDDFIFKIKGNSKTLTFGKNGNYNYVSIKGITATELSSMFTLIVTPKDGTEPVATITYGAFTYVRTQLKSEDEKLRNLVKALYLYARAASDYMDKK